MGIIAQRLSQARKRNEYYATSSSKKRKIEETPRKPTEIEIRQQKASDRNKQKQEERKELKKEVQQMQASAPSNPCILFPFLDISNSGVSSSWRYFNRAK